ARDGLRAGVEWWQEPLAQVAQFVRQLGRPTGLVTTKLRQFLAEVESSTERLPHNAVSDLGSLESFAGSPTRAFGFAAALSRLDMGALSRLFALHVYGSSRMPESAATRFRQMEVPRNDEANRLGRDFLRAHGRWRVELQGLPPVCPV